MANDDRDVAAEAERVRRFRDGDEAAFGELVTAHRGAVYAVCRRICFRHEDADEAAQLAFVRAWNAREQFRADAAFRTWVVRIAINVSRSLLARQKPTEGLDDAPEPVDPARSALGDLESDARGRALRDAVAKLPERQRMVVTLKVFSEMTHREVAAAMDISEGAVKAHLHQAISNLRRHVGEAEATSHG